MSEKVYHLKLTNGKDIIGVMKGHVNDIIILDKPIEVEWIDGEVSAYPYGFIFGESTKLRFNVRDTNVCSPAIKSVSTLYYSMFENDENEIIRDDSNDDELSTDSILQYSKYYQ